MTPTLESYLSARRQLYTDQRNLTIAEENAARAMLDAQRNIGWSTDRTTEAYHALTIADRAELAEIDAEAQADAQEEANYRAGQAAMSSACGY